MRKRKVAIPSQVYRLLDLIRLEPHLGHSLVKAILTLPSPLVSLTLSVPVCRFALRTLNGLLFGAREPTMTTSLAFSFDYHECLFHSAYSIL